MKHLYQNSEVIYCAESLDECDRLFTEDIGESPQEIGDVFEQIDDGKPLEVGADEPSGDPREIERLGKHGGSFWFVTQLARQWAEESEPGHFSGGDY